MGQLVHQVEMLRREWRLVAGEEQIGKFIVAKDAIKTGLGSQRGMTVNEPDVRGIVEADFVQLCQKKDTYRSNGNQAQPAPTNDAAAEGGKKSGKWNVVDIVHFFILSKLSGESYSLNFYSFYAIFSAISGFHFYLLRKKRKEGLTSVSLILLKLIFFRSKKIFCFPAKS